MTALADVSKRAGAPIQGVYRLISAAPGHSPVDGRPTIRLTIADSTASRICGAYLTEGTSVWETLCVGTLVAITGRIAQTPRAHAYVHLTACQPVTVADRPSWHLLPILCVPAPAHPAFRRLLGLLDRLECPVLRPFMDRVLADTELAERFVSLPSPGTTPGTRPGSLLMDSVARAEKSERLAPMLLSPEDAERLIVAALLRDIGATHKANRQAPFATGCLESMTFNVLSEHLEALAAESRNAGLALCEMLAPGVVAKGTGLEKPTLCTDLIKALDTLTTGEELRRTHHELRTSAGGMLARFFLPDL